MDTEQISQLSLMLLPPEILERILTNLNAEQLALVSAVCRTINTNAEFVALTRGVHSDDDPTIRYTVGRAPYLASFERITDRSYSGHGALELLSHLPSAVLARYTDAILHIMRNGENVRVKSLNSLYSS